MQWLTALILGVFGGYALGWYFGAIEGNFALLLFLATLVTGCYWVAERLVFLPRRRAAAAELEAQQQARQAELQAQGIQRVDEGAEVQMQQARQRLLQQPWWLDWTAGLFPVIAVVFVLRSFVFEPFKIPSGSMIPTLLVGDLILVNKFTYGLKLPVLNTRLTQGKEVVRGDVVVFRYPPQPSVDYIKRVIGVPGDEVAYLDKRLMINGKPVPTTAMPEFLEAQSMVYFPQFEESLGAKNHHIIVNPNASARIGSPGSFEFKQNCLYTVDGVTCTVPEGHYFVMGDNRDNSLDSRYWGFVPEANIVGRAFYVWMNFGNLGRIGGFN